MTVANYQEIAQRKRQLRDDQFIKEWLVPEEELPKDKDVTAWITTSGHLKPKEIEITEANAIAIVNNIKARTWSAYEVAAAFAHRASIAHQLTNCLLEVFFEEGLQRAKQLDEYQEAHGTTVGPFHGLPISLKDNLNIKGHATTVGMVSFCFNPEKFEEDAVIVGMLRDLGAVFYAKTNVPVAMMMPETTNHIYGNTTNPLNRDLSAGGSSGGESALLALKGSPLGIGLDIGGLLRIPASFTNLYTLKPSFGRFPTYGSRLGLPGLESVNSVNGPLSWSLESLEYYCEVMTSADAHLRDAKVVHLPWRPVELPNKLNIAIVEDDMRVRPTPPIQRGLKIVKEALLQGGHDVIDWAPTGHLRLSELITAFFLSDGGKHVRQQTDLTGEPFFPYMKMYGTTPELPVSELWKLQAERTTLIKQYLDRWMALGALTKNGRPIDAIVMPATPFPGNPNGKFHDHVGYTSPFNALDWSVAVFPVTRADQAVDVKEPREVFHTPTDEKVWQDYNPAESHGGAVALQLVGRRFEEEKVVKMVGVISGLL